MSLEVKAIGEHNYGFSQGLRRLFDIGPRQCVVAQCLVAGTSSTSVQPTLFRARYVLQVTAYGEDVVMMLNRRCSYCILPCGSEDVIRKTRLASCVPLFGCRSGFRV